MGTYHDSTQASITTTPDVSVATPTLSDGDWVYLWIFTRGSTTVSAAPSGFTPIPDATGTTGTTASSASIFSYRRYVATASGEPANYTATMSTNCNGSVICASYSGFGSADPMQDAAFLADAAGGDAVITAPAATSTTDDTLAISIAAMNTSAGVASWSAAGVTEDEDVATVAATSRVSAALGHKTVASAGSTGTTDWSASLVSGTAYGSGAGLTIVIGAPAVAASAGSDQVVAPGTTVTLDGSASTGTAVSRSWSQVSGDYDVTDYLQTPTAATSDFIAPAPVNPGAMLLVFEHEVVGADNTDADQVTITVSPAGAGGGTLSRQVLGADGLPL